MVTARALKTKFTEYDTKNNFGRFQEILQFIPFKRYAIFKALMVDQ